MSLRDPELGGAGLLFGDATIAPRGAPQVEVVTAAKTALAAGSAIDGIGGFATYGLCERADEARAARLLPLGLAAECRLRRDVARDVVLTYDDVELPPDRLCDRLRAEQEARFAPTRAGARIDVRAAVGAVD